MRINHRQPRQLFVRPEPGRGRTEGGSVAGSKSLLQRWLFRQLRRQEACLVLVLAEEVLDQDGRFVTHNFQWPGEPLVQRPVQQGVTEEEQSNYGQQGQSQRPGHHLGLELCAQHLAPVLHVEPGQIAD